MNKKTVTFITTGLGRGGAENSLIQLLSAIPRNEFSLKVVSLQDGGDYVEELRKLQIPLISLKLHKKWNWLLGFLKLAWTLRKQKPDCVVTWMYHANVIGGSIAWLLGTKDIFWNVRHSTIGGKDLKPSTRAIVKLGALLSYFIPTTITFNSYRAAGVHVAAKYDLKKARVIHNGFNTEELYSNKTEGAAVRNTLGITPDERVVANLGRYDPVKNHIGFLDALAQINSRNIPVVGLLAGTNIDLHNKILVSKAEELGVLSSVRFLGKRDDIRALLNASDVLCVSSWTESFPRVLGEAMACEVLCVTTDVGEARSIVGQAGIVVGNSENLASGIQQALELPKSDRMCRTALGRKRIESLFSEQRTVKQFIAQLRG